MAHQYTRLKGGLSTTVKQWVTKHDDGTETIVRVKDQSDNVAEDDPSYVVFAETMAGDGSGEKLDWRTIDSHHDDEKAIAAAEEWMAANPDGL